MRPRGNRPGAGPGGNRGDRREFRQDRRGERHEYRENRWNERHEFYEGGFLRPKPRGSLDAILRVKIPDAKPVNFRVHKIIFLEQPVQPVSSW